LHKQLSISGTSRGGRSSEGAGHGGGRNVDSSGDDGDSLTSGIEVVVEAGGLDGSGRIQDVWYLYNKLKAVVEGVGFTEEVGYCDDASRGGADWRRRSFWLEGVPAGDGAGVAAAGQSARVFCREYYGGGCTGLHA